MIDLLSLTEWLIDWLNDLINFYFLEVVNDNDDDDGDQLSKWYTWHETINNITL